MRSRGTTVPGTASIRRGTTVCPGDYTSDERDPRMSTRIDLLSLAATALRLRQKFKENWSSTIASSRTRAHYLGRLMARMLLNGGKVGFSFPGCVISMG